jgi:uncharacterized protein
MNSNIDRLENLLISIETCVVAVSGGVDSMTLAFIAHSMLGPSAIMFHATSPAVPSDAYERIKEYSIKYGWNLSEINAGELNDSSYTLNPVYRCYYCKTNLYKSIRYTVGENIAILSGANMDDLSDYRPGLLAAKKYNVRHPYIESQFSKKMVRFLAKYYDLVDLADLPASPCLSSRIETGININKPLLELIDKIESYVRIRFSSNNIRARILNEGVELQVDEYILDEIICYTKLKDKIQLICKDFGKNFIGFSTYQMGSTFIHSK